MFLTPLFLSQETTTCVYNYSKKTSSKNNDCYSCCIRFNDCIKLILKICNIITCVSVFKLFDLLLELHADWFNDTFLSRTTLGTYIFLIKNIFDLAAFFFQVLNKASKPPSQISFSQHTNLYLLIATRINLIPRFSCPRHCSQFYFYNRYLYLMTNKNKTNWVPVPY